MSAKKPKKFSVKKSGAPNSDINVTPLVDVVLVLLIIFMTLTPLLEKDIEIQVPPTEQVQDTSDVPPDQLIVSLDDKSEIRINGQKINSDEEYKDKLKEKLDKKKKEDRLVFFMPDEKSNYGRLVTALDGAKMAGAEILGMMTEIPEGMNPNGAAPAGTPSLDGAAPPPPPPDGTPGTP